MATKDGTRIPQRITRLPDSAQAGGKRYPAETVHDFMRLVFKLQHIKQRHGRGDGRQPEWLVMMACALERVEGREADITSIAAQSGLPRSTVKRIIDAMVRTGDLRVDRSPRDARRRIISHTNRRLDETLDMICEMIDAMADFARQSVPGK